MIFNVDVINILLILTFAVNTAYGLIIYLRNRSILVNKAFFFLTLTVSSWILSMLSYRGFSNHSLAMISVRWLYVSAALIPPVLVYFAIIFTGKKLTVSRLKVALFLFPIIATILISILPGALLIDVIDHTLGEKVTIYNIYLHLVYGAYIVSYLFYAHYIILEGYLSSSGLRRIQLRNVFAGTFFALIFGLVCNLILPFFGIFTFNWLGQIAVMGMIISIFYSIIKYNLFNVRVIVAEILVFALWFILFTRIYFSLNGKEFIPNILIFILAIIIGLFLTRSVRKEIETREYIEKLNTQLQELDELKSELVSLATHHISNPLTAIKGYVSLLQEKTMGEGDQEEKDILDSLERLTNNVVTIVRDFLDVSRIQNRQECYIHRNVDIEKFLCSLVQKYKLIAENKGLALAYNCEQNKGFIVKADEHKLTQAVTNILENCLRYTTRGRIGVSLKRENEMAIIIISDTSERKLPAISSKLSQKFINSGNRDGADIIMNGLGLYVAKQIINAHKGNFKLNSFDSQAGMQFIIELPLA